jgi:hypothetical protein
MSITPQMGVFHLPGEEGINMPEKETESSFDAAAEIAQPELAELLEAMSEEELSGAKKVLSWQKKWYLLAGHKRLGRIIVEFAKTYTC